MNKLLLLLLLSISALMADEIRYNQLAYRTNDAKQAFLTSFTPSNETSFAGDSFFLIDTTSGDTVFTGTVSESLRPNGFTAFEQIRICDFTALTIPGIYRIACDTLESGPFAIGGEKEYLFALESLFDFFSSQRCGDSTSLMHDACHLNDSLMPIDARGGWHDAADYIKYMITVGWTTIEMLVTVDYGLDYFPDGLIDTRGESGIPDVLEEARVGLEWILKMTRDLDNDKLYYQVAGEEDHLYWRVPEEDDTNGLFDPHREIFEGWGYNLTGKCVAALSMGARFWTEHDSLFAADCLTRAEELWRRREDFPGNQASNPTDFYSEGLYPDDLLLGAVELFRATDSSLYSEDALDYFSGNRGLYCNWGQSDFLALAQAHRAGIGQNYAKSAMKAAMTTVSTHSEEHSFFCSGPLVWGSSAEFTSNAQMVLIYTFLTGDSSYLPLADLQRDYLFGANNWGVSFMIGIGNTYPLTAHSQLNDLVALQQGGVVGGPATAYDWSNYFASPPEEADDRFFEFQGKEVYYDILSDYYTNEVAIDYTVPSLFLMSYYLATSNDSTITPVATPRAKLTEHSSRITLIGSILYFQDLTAPTTITLYSVAGRAIDRFKLSEGSHSVELKSGLSQGIYLLKGESSKQIIQSTIVVK